MMKQAEDKDEQPKIICMPASIRLFRLYGAFPPADRLLNPGKRFYIKFVMIALYSSVILVGSSLHLLKTIQGSLYLHVYQQF